MALPRPMDLAVDVLEALASEAIEKCKRSDAGCLEYEGTIDDDGYATRKYRRRKLRLSRVVYAAKSGSPDGMLVCHHCDNRKCLEVSHLFLGTCEDNSLDAKAKGRLAYGSRNGAYTRPERVLRGSASGKAKLTEDKVLEIRRRFAAGGVTMSALAAEYGLAQPNVKRIVSGVGWSHVGEALGSFNGRVGEASPKTTLTADQVHAIRRDYANGIANQVQLAKQYGVSQSSISAILLRRTWKHLEATA